MTDEEIAKKAAEDIVINVWRSDNWRAYLTQRVFSAIKEAKGPRLPPGDDGYIMHDFL
jgi:hypothetical protein